MGTLTFLHINSFTNNCTNKLFLWTTCMFSKEIKYWANGMGWGKLPPNAVKGPHCHSSPERGRQAVQAAVRAAEGGSSWRAKGSEGHRVHQGIWSATHGPKDGWPLSIWEAPGLVQTEGEGGTRAVDQWAFVSRVGICGPMEGRDESPVFSFTSFTC